MVTLFASLDINFIHCDMYSLPNVDVGKSFIGNIKILIIIFKNYTSKRRLYITRSFPHDTTYSLAIHYLEMAKNSSRSIGQLNMVTARYSEGSLFRSFEYSEGSLFRRFVIPKVRYSKGSIVRK